jgi:hypothetical protein
MQKVKMLQRIAVSTESELVSVKNVELALRLLKGIVS